MTPNQVVAHNLRRARIRKDWTQEEAAEHLEPFLGERWSKATFSAAETSAEGGRRRVFSADELYAFARCFELPLAFFLAPTSIEEEIAAPGATEGTSREQAFDLCFGLPESVQDALMGRDGWVLELSAHTTRALNRWRDEYAAAAEKRAAEVRQFRELAENGEAS